MSSQDVNAKLQAGWLNITIDKTVKKRLRAEFLATQKNEESHKELKELGITEFDNRQYCIDISKEYNEKQEKKEKKYKISAAVSIFSDYFEMAEKFIEQQPIFYTNQKIWWLWNFENHCWEMIDEIDLLNQMNKTTYGLQLFKTQVKNEILNALKMQGRLNIPKDAKKSWIQFKDKIFDIETGNTFEATPEYFVTNPIPYGIGESEKTPEIDKLFTEWVGEENIQKLFEITAYALLADYPLHRVFCLNGEGRNGKGSFLNLLTKFIGESNLCSTDFDVLTTRPFEAAKLYKKLVCIMGEINSSIFKRTSLFKKLTGADLIGFEFKGKDGFDDYNYAKLIIATNKLPESTDKTVGFYSRWLIVDFPNRFKEKPNLLNIIPEEEYSNLAKKSIKIIKELLEKGEFYKEGNIEERTKRYEERASPIREFLKTCCELQDASETPFWELYADYAAYLDERGFRKASKRELSNLMKARGFETKRVHFTKSDGSDGTMVVVLGIVLAGNLEEKIEKSENEEDDSDWGLLRR